ncbi:MAG TPA: adenylate/guanylate cyclase domain-containing protein [Actinomycetota bacterium]
MQICPNCGEENPDRFRLCGICGTKLAPEEVAQEVRKTVTVVFSDLKGSTNLGEQLDTESLREVLSVYFNEMRAVLERHGGTVEKYIGDAIMAVFGLPMLHEDDALRAVRAAYQMKLTLEEVNERLEKGWGVRLENRTGVNTGEVVAGDISAGQRLVTGDTVNTTARLEQNAPSCEILIGEPTYRLVRDAVEVEQVEPLELKGKAERVPAYRLISVAEREEGMARRLDSPMVGRGEELAVLMGALDHTDGDGSPQMVTVFGPAGVGKSRLLHEFLSRASGRVRALRGHCLSYGEGITFWPLGEVIREAMGITNDDSLVEARSKLAAFAGEHEYDAAERVAAAIGLSDATFPVQETFWGARRLVELMTRDQPTVMLIDDIHWAEETFLDLLRYLLEAVQAPLMLVCSSRPELLEEHAEWIQETDKVNRIVLRPLSEAESAQVAQNLLGSSLDEGVRARIVEAAEGNPLFVEQMLSMLIDDGVLRRSEDGSWTLVGDLGSISIPPTISALLTARLDRLGATERTVIDRGSVVGQVFFRGAVEALVPEGVRSQVGASLQGLHRKELISPDEVTFAGQEAYRFQHILIRDAAYHGLLKRTRAELHERFVDWLEQIASDRVMEFEEIRGYHLEQAYLIRIQLGPLDDLGVQVGRRGARYLSSAGRRALGRSDMPAAASLLQRAAALLGPNEKERPKLLLEAADALIELGEFATADGVLEKAWEEAEALDERAVATTIGLARLHQHYATEGQGSEEEIIDEAKRAISVLEALGYHEGLARAWRLLTLVLWTALRNADAEEAARRAIEHARLAGSRILEVQYLSALATSATWGPTPVPEAIKVCEEILEAAAGDRKAESRALNLLAHLLAERGEIDRARDLYRQSRALLEEYGMKLSAALTSLDSGLVELIAGDPEVAEAELRRDYEELDRMGESNYRATIAGFLAEALYRQGRLEAAEEFARICREITAADDLVSQIYWRSVLGRALARRGEFEGGRVLLMEAHEMIHPSDELDSKGKILVDLAEVNELSGRLEEAAAALEEAVQLFEAKGNVVSRSRARERLVNLRVAPENPVSPIGS